MDSLVKGEDAKTVQKPICFYPTKDEDKVEVSAATVAQPQAEHFQMDKFVEIIKANPAIADKSVFKTFTEACHGFAAARADVSRGCYCR